MMTDSTRTTVDQTGGSQADPSISPVMLTVGQVARMLNCSTRTVYRLNDAGRMPHPVRLGALVRWNREQIERWVAAGCPKPERSAR